MNAINKIRKEILKYFNPENLLREHELKSISPNKKYRLESKEFQQDKSDVNWTVAKIKVYDNETNKELKTFFVNDGRFFHSWINKNDTDYLICPEDIYGGQTIFDLTNNNISSYSPDQDGFIWADYFLSPNKNYLAIFGCIWAYPYEIRVYNFEDPMNLPLNQIQSIDMTGYKFEKIGWENNLTLNLEKHTGELKKINTAHNIS